MTPYENFLSALMKYIKAEKRHKKSQKSTVVWEEKCKRELDQAAHELEAAMNTYTLSILPKHGTES